MKKNYVLKFPKAKLLIIVLFVSIIKVNAVNNIVTLCGSTSWSGTTTSNSCSTRNSYDQQYQFVAPVSGTYTFSTCSAASWDTWLYLSTGSCYTGTGIANNDDACGTQSSITVTLTGGTTYYLLLESFTSGGTGGAYTINVTSPYTDNVAPTYVGYSNVTGYSYYPGSGNTYWVKGGNNFGIDISHTDNCLAREQYFTFTNNNCGPNGCGGAPNEIKSYSTASSFTDWMANDAYINITSAACVGACNGTSMTKRWQSTVASTCPDWDYYLWTYLYDQVNNGLGYTSMGVIMKVDNSAPTVPSGPTCTSGAGTGSQSWSCGAATDSRSGINASGYEWQYSYDNTNWNAWFTGGTSNSGNFGCGSTLYVRVRSKDNVGNVSAWATGSSSLDVTAPTKDACTVSSNCWIPDNSNTYTITLKASESVSGIGGAAYGMMALINYQGAHAGSYGGYIQWNTTQALLNTNGFTKDQIAATGGGYAGIYASGYGFNTITLVSATTSVSGNQRTVTFTVRPNGDFPAFTDNDISFYAMDGCGKTSNWSNYDLNFASEFSNAYTVNTPTGASLGISVPASSSTGQIAKLNGSQFAFTATTWPNCANWGLPKTLYVANGNNLGGACTFPDAVTFDANSTFTSLSGGNLCFTGTTTLNNICPNAGCASYGSVTLPVRLRIQIRKTSDNSALPIERVGNYLMVRANQNFYVNAFIECQAVSGTVYYTGSITTIASNGTASTAAISNGNT